MFPVTARVGGGSPDRLGGGSPDRVVRGLPTGGQGSKVYVLSAEPKEHKHFRPGTRPRGFGYPAGRIGDRGDRRIVYVLNVYVPFPAPRKQYDGHISSEVSAQLEPLDACLCRFENAVGFFVLSHLPKAPKVAPARRHKKSYHTQYPPHENLCS